MASDKNRQGNWARPPLDQVSPDPWLLCLLFCSNRDIGSRTEPGFMPVWILHAAGSLVPGAWNVSNKHYAMSNGRTDRWGSWCWEKPVCTFLCMAWWRDTRVTTAMDKACGSCEGLLWGQCVWELGGPWEKPLRLGSACGAGRFEDELSHEIFLASLPGEWPAQHKNKLILYKYVIRDKLLIE